MSLDSKFFVSLCSTSSVSVMIADGTPMPLEGVGSIVTLNLSLYNIYHIFKLTLNLPLPCLFPCPLSFPLPFPRP